MNYRPVFEPWRHQADARERARDEQFFAFLMEMGTGKTKVAIDEFCELYVDGKVDTVLILAPKGVYMNWLRTELPTHMPDSIRQESMVSVWYSGGGGTRAQRDQLQAILSPHPGLRILLMNTEALSSGDKARRFAEAYLRTGRQRYIAVDESTYIKSPTASRTKNVCYLGRFAEYRRIMTGAPVTRSPLDLYSQFEFLEQGLLGQSFYSFRARYAVLKDQRFGGRKVTTVVGYRNVEELAQRIRPWSFRVTKEECLDLPPKLYTSRVVELTEQQERIYSEMREFALAELDGAETVSAMAVITQLLRLQQVLCGHVVDDTGAIHDLETQRMDVLLEVLEEAPGKVIVWSRFRHDITKIVAKISEIWGPQAVVQFHGGNAQTRHVDAERFMEDPDCLFMVATQGAGGHGNTWVVADTVVYYSNDYDLEKRIQSEDRAHRAGQTRRVTYVDLIAPGTVDDKIVRALRSKIDMASTITGDSYREWLV